MRWRWACLNYHNIWSLPSVWPRAVELYSYYCVLYGIVLPLLSLKTLLLLKSRLCSRFSLALSEPCGINTHILRTTGIWAQSRLYPKVPSTVSLIFTSCCCFTCYCVKEKVMFKPVNTNVILTVWIRSGDTLNPLKLLTTLL